MTSLPVLFDSLEILDAEKHKGLKISKDTSYKHSKKSHFVPIVVGEASFLSKHFPISFVKNPDSSYSLVAILGFEEGNNAFVDENGNWLAEYVPLYIRTYPFIGVQVEGEENKKVICIDKKAGHFAGNGGDSLFDKKGSPTDILNMALKMSEDFDISSRQTDVFCQEMAKVGAIELKHEVSAFGNVQYYGLNLEVLEKLAVKKATEWQERGYLNIINHINFSNRGWREIELRSRIQKGVDQEGQSGRA